MRKISIARRRSGLKAKGDSASGRDGYQGSRSYLVAVRDRPEEERTSEGRTVDTSLISSSEEEKNLAFPLTGSQVETLGELNDLKDPDFTATIQQDIEGLFVLEIHSNKNSMKRLMNAAEVSLKLGLSRSSIYRLVSGGRLRAYRIGRLLRFAPEDVDAFLSGC